MKNKTIKKVPMIMVFLISIIQLFSQAPTLNEHVGLNITFSTTDNYSNADSVCNNFREFHAWRNATYGAGNVFTNDSDTFPQDWPTLMNSNIPKNERYKYNFDPNYGKMYKVLSKNGNSIFPAITTSHQFLTTNAVVFNGTDLAHDPGYISKQCLQRKPVPHIFDTTTMTLKLAKNEDYLKPNSYRFFGEYMGYLSIVFGQNDLDITKNELYLDGDDYPFVGKNQTQYIEYFNEPDAWWTWSPKEGYFQPAELATAVSVGYDGHGGSIQTDIYGDENPEPTYPDFECGSKYHSPDLKIVSPGLHEMNIDYLKSFLQELRKIRHNNNLETIEFDVYNFHHYSAYRVNDLKSKIGNTIDPESIVEASLTPSRQTKRSIQIQTVDLESSITGSDEDKIWIHPELDGYKLRGKKLRASLTELGCNSESEIWVSEWGYPSVIHGNDAQYHEIRPEKAQARWLIRGFMEYQASTEIDRSYWHWYKDQENNAWDNNCGLVDFNEKQKLSWYYLKTMQDEIGDKTLIAMRDVDNCGENFAWSYDLRSMKPVKPKYIEASCPRIYQYNGQDKATFEDDVWTIWIPTAAELIPETKKIWLDDIFGEAIFEKIPNAYSVVHPGIPGIDFRNSIIPLSIDENGKYYMEPEISDEPIFVHFHHDPNIKTGNLDLKNVQSSMKIFPNPTTNFINFEIDNLTEFENAKIVITDILGQVLMEIKIQKGIKVIQQDLNLPSGLYLCELVTDGGVKGVSKMIVE